MITTGVYNCLAFTAYTGGGGSGRVTSLARPLI
jgi:hypothetical protein